MPKLVQLLLLQRREIRWQVEADRVDDSKSVRKHRCLKWEEQCNTGQANRKATDRNGPEDDLLARVKLFRWGVYAFFDQAAAQLDPQQVRLVRNVVSHPKHK